MLSGVFAHYNRRVPLQGYAADAPYVQWLSYACRLLLYGFSSSYRLIDTIQSFFSDAVLGSSDGLLMPCIMLQPPRDVGATADEPVEIKQ